MKQTGWANKNSHIFVLPLSTDPSPDEVGTLSFAIRSLPPNLKLSLTQRRFIDIIVPLLFSAGLFYADVSLHQITQLFKRYVGDPEINSLGVGWLIEGSFRNSEAVESGIYQVVRSDDGYRFQFNEKVLPLILASIK